MQAGLSDHPSAPPIHGYDKDMTDDASEQITGVRSPAKLNGSILMRESMLPANARINQSETTTRLVEMFLHNKADLICYLCYVF